MPASPFVRHLPDTLFNLSPTQLLLLLLAIAAVLFFTGIGLRPPWPAAAPRFAELARAMGASGKWLDHTRGGQLLPDEHRVPTQGIASVA